MEIMLRNPGLPATWDNGHRPCITRYTYLQTEDLTDVERTKLIECVRVVKNLLGVGQAHVLARLLVAHLAVTQPIVERYWRRLEKFYRTAPHRNPPKEAARIAKLDTVLNAFCAALIGEHGAAEVLEKYLKSEPVTPDTDILGAGDCL
jgi:hypothetical protein